MTPEDYRQALRDRGFRFHEKQNLWVGPFNIQTNGQWNWDLRRFADSSRVEELAVIDEKLRAARGLERDPPSGGASPGLFWVREGEDEEL